jgi:hypothetical protein
VLIIDDAGWSYFENFYCENVCVVRGVYHNRRYSPYKNIAIALNYAYNKYPTSDWYNYIESDVFYLNDYFKKDLTNKENYADLGFCYQSHTNKQGDAWLVEKILDKKTDACYMLGAVHFYSNYCIKNLMDFDFFSKVLEETKDYKGTYFPNFSHCAIEEIIYPTAAHFCGPVGNLSNDKNCYSVRFSPEISKNDINQLTSIVHPSKKLHNRRVLQWMQSKKPVML